MLPINKTRIAKNTAALYFRMLLTMLIAFYTLRVVMNVLGVEDYGTYVTISGAVLMFGFLSGTMATASQRFFAMELGVENHVKLKQLFSINVLIFIGLAILIFILAETVGLWYFLKIMKIPPDRMEAAVWVYQFAIFTFMVSIITTPYLAIITAREKLTVYAYLSVLEVVFKLAILYVLIYTSMDKLKLYAVLLFAVQILISAAYITYSTLKFPECKVKYYWNKAMFKEVFGFAGWNVIGVLAMTARSYGITLLLNAFFGVIINAARGAALLVYSALNQFAHNFFTAVRPQLIKSYSIDPEDKSGEMMKLVFQSSKFCYYLILVLSLPILIETRSILDIWLKGIVPEYTVIFTRLIIINAIIESLANPFIASIQATGRIKMYQIVTGSIILLNLPVSYLFLKLGFPPQSTMYISIAITIIAHLSRIYFMNKMLKMNILNYVKYVILPILGVTILVLVLPLLFYYNFSASFWRIAGVATLTVVSSAFIVYYIGLTKSERETLKMFVLKKMKRK
ncbi:MAG: lipopolysaccharide biosynthesis protein [Bacteroidetes bacterium]|nr:lipopolysaccharide biosynthesis protein [Bacteroidota bacterium]MCL2303371.1 lipopolysaccharide biosynthesis protein [Lentimicrobiaceae bacterium]